MFHSYSDKVWTIDLSIWCFLNFVSACFKLWTVIIINIILAFNKPWFTGIYSGILWFSVWKCYTHMLSVVCWFTTSLHVDLNIHFQLIEQTLVCHLCCDTLQPFTFIRLFPFHFESLLQKREVAERMKEVNLSEELGCGRYLLPPDAPKK